MMKPYARAIGRLFNRVWLPLFIVVGTSWLLIPPLAHEHYGTLKLISSDEATYSGAIFRIADMCAALLLILAAWRFRLLRHERWVGVVVLVIAVLAAIDGLFPDTCYVGHQACSVFDMAVSWVHDIETVVLGAAVATLSIADAIRSRRNASIIFVLLQLLIALLFLTGLVPSQAMAVLQYVYETTLIIWLGWFVDGYRAGRPSPVPERAARLVVGIWAAVSGVLALVTALPHVHFAHDLRVWSGTPVALLLEQHSIIVGVLLLYLARHLLRGERPALWLTAAIVYSQAIKYSLLTPQALAAGISIVALALLIYARGSFDRHTVARSWTSRLGDVAVVSTGAVVAALAVLVVLGVSGERMRFVHEVQHLYDYRYHALQTREGHLSERTAARLRVLVETLGVSLVAVTLWSLFRPAGKATPILEARLGREFMQYLLEGYSDSSEDYFKLWPHDKSYFVSGKGAIAYRVEGGIAFMLADPITPAQQRTHILKEFIAYARQHGWTVCVLIIGGKSPKLYEAAGLKTLQIGSSALIDVDTFCTHTARTKWWRWQRNRGEREGWQYSLATPPHNPTLLQELRQVSDVWLGEKGRSEQGFALGYFDETYLQACKLHVLRSADGNIIAFANELPLFAGGKQTTVDLIRYLPDEQGAMPVLLMRAIEHAGTEGFTHFDLGFVPLAKVENELARLLRRIGAIRFSAQGLEQFKNKFDPTWQPDYLAYDGDLLDLARIAANLERLFKVDTKRSSVE